MNLLLSSSMVLYSDYNTICFNNVMVIMYMSKMLFLSHVTDASFKNVIDDSPADKT